jgi:hypothetical protein
VVGNWSFCNLQVTCGYKFVNDHFREVTHGTWGTMEALPVLKFSPKFSPKSHENLILTCPSQLIDSKDLTHFLASSATRRLSTKAQFHPPSGRSLSKTSMPSAILPENSNSQKRSFKPLPFPFSSRSTVKRPEIYSIEPRRYSVCDIGIGKPARS